MKNILHTIKKWLDDWFISWFMPQSDNQSEILVPKSTYDQTVFELQNEKRIHQFYITREKQLLDEIEARKASANKLYNELKDTIAMCDDEILQVAKGMFLNKSIVINPDSNTEIHIGKIVEVSIYKGIVKLRGTTEYSSTLSHLMTISNIKQLPTWQ